MVLSKKGNGSFRSSPLAPRIGRNFCYVPHHTRTKLEQDFPQFFFERKLHEGRSVFVHKLYVQICNFLLHIYMKWINKYMNKYMKWMWRKLLRGRRAILSLLLVSPGRLPTLHEDNCGLPQQDDEVWELRQVSQTSH